MMKGRPSTRLKYDVEVQASGLGTWTKVMRLASLAPFVLAARVITKREAEDGPFNEATHVPKQALLQKNSPLIGRDCFKTSLQC